MADSLRTSAGSHERFLVLEVFGRYAGFTAMLPTMAGATNRCVIPEDRLISNWRGRLRGGDLGATALSGRDFGALGDRECKVKKRRTLGGTIARQFSGTLIPF